MRAEPDPAQPESFLEASQRPSSGLLADTLQFLRESKKWWLVPILVVLALVAGVLIVAALAPAAVPFIYPI